MATDAYSQLFQTLENILAPGGRARISPYVESAQFRVLFGEAPDPQKRFESAQTILEHQAERIEALANAWRIFVDEGKSFTENDYSNSSFLDAYLAYYFTTNVAKIQICLLDLARRNLLKGSIDAVDLGVGTATTFVGLIDFLVAWSSVCDLYDAPFPITDVRLTGFDSSPEGLSYATQVLDEYANALEERATTYSNGTHARILDLAITWAGSASWQKHDLDKRPLALSDANLVFASNVFNELSVVGKRNLAQTLAGMQAAAIGIVIEPGSQYKSQSLMAWRRSVIMQYPQLSAIGPCGAELGSELSIACDTCWNARREALQQTELYRAFRTGLEERIGGQRHFDEYGKSPSFLELHNSSSGLFVGCRSSEAHRAGE